MSEAQITKFFEVARERYKILLSRRAGFPKPWSSNPIFQTEYFCNVFREDDKTTAWFRENMREMVSRDPVASLLTIVAFRWFNKIEVGKVLKDPSVGLQDGTFFPDTAKALLTAAFPRGPYVTGAYIIKTPDGMDKLTGVLWCIDQFRHTMHKEKNLFENLLNGRYTVQTACELLKHAPYLGNFMAWQICSDARFTCLLENAPDRDTWAQPGPGSARGLGRVFYNDVNHFKYGSKSDEAEMLLLMRELVAHSKDKTYWPVIWPAWAVVDVSHQLCEYDKYERCEQGGRMKRKYNAS